MNLARSKKAGEPFPRFLLPTGVFLALSGAGIVPAYAGCTAAGTTVSCSGAANPLSPSYTNGGNNLNVTVNPGGSLGVLLGVGGNALTLIGNNNTLTNNGTIDPSLLGTGLGVLSSGAVIGNASASTTTVTNNGTMKGSTGVALSGATGMALAVQNGTDGTSNITNTGTISSTALVGATLVGADAPVVVAYGGAQVNFNNSGTINGRVAFQSSGTPGTGNTFTNSGTINGSVSMGVNSTNTFTANTGSSVNSAGGTGASLNLGIGAVTIGIAATGTVDGGAGGNNTLKLQQAGGGPATGAINNTNYINFQHMEVGSGTWTLTGASSAQDATLNGGVAIIDNNAGLGTGTITGNGGAIQSANSSVNLNNGVTLAAGGLTVQGGNNLALSGTISGGGSLTKNGTGTLTLSGANTHSGGTALNGGEIMLGNSSGLGTGTLTVGGAGTLDTNANMTVANNVAINGGATLTLGGSNSLELSGAVSGAGGLVKNGAATTTLTGANTYTGGTTVNSGTLALGAGGSLAATGGVNLAGAGATFDISASGANQTIGALSGAAGTTVALGGNGLTLGDATNATFSGTIGGTGAITKQGSGTETLTGANTYTGGTTINGGTLAIGVGGSLAATGSVNLGTAGAGFDISGAGANQTVGALSGVGGTTVSLGANTLTFGDATNQTFGGAIGGTGGIVKQGTGTQTLTGANTYTGGTTVNAGTIAIGAGGSLSSTGTVNLANTGTALDVSGATTPQAIGGLAGAAGSSVNLGSKNLTLGDAGNHTFAGTIGGTGGITKSGTGTETLTGTNTYTGGTTIAGGTLALGAGGSLAASGAVNLSGAGSTFDISASGAPQTIGALSGVGGTTVALGGNGLTLGDATNATFSGTIGGTGAITKQGSGTETLTGANTYTGGTTINGGTLAIGVGGSLAATGSVNLGTAGAGFDISGAGANQTIGALSGVGGTTVSLGANTLTFGDTTNQTFGGAIGGTGGIVKQGTGTQTLTGANTYTGGTTVNAGTIAIGAGGSLSSTGTVNLANTGTALDVSGATTPQAIGGLEGAAGSSVNLGSKNLTLGDAGNHTFAGTIGGTGGITKSGTGTETLTGVNTYTGGTTIASGTLALGAGGRISGSSVDLTGAGATFDISSSGASQTIGALNGVANSNVTLGGNTLVFGDGTNGAFAGTIAGTGGLFKQGSGTETLTGVNTYTGLTTIGGGTLAIGVGGSIAASSTVNLGASGTKLDLSGAGANQTIGALMGVAGSTVALGGNGLTFGSTASQTFAGAITGTGSVTKQGSGTEMLTGTNTYTGGTTINDGTLALGAGGSLAATGALNLGGAGAIFDITTSGANQTIGALSGVNGSSVRIGGQSLTFGDGTNATFGGSIVGTGGITKEGSGTETLTGVNTFTGDTTIANGTLAIGAGGSIASSNAVNLTGTGTTLDISASGNASIGALNGVATSNVTLGASTLTLGNGTNGAFAGTIAGTGGVTKQGSGTETLTGVNTYTGTTTINGGTLAIGAGGSIASSGTVDLGSAGAKLDLSGAGANQTIGALTGVAGSTVALGGNDLTFGGTASQTFAGAITGTAGVTKQGAGTETLTGVNTYTGGTTIAGGTLAIGAGGALAATGSVNLGTPGASFDISASGANHTIGALSGVGGTTVSLGANTLTFGDATNQTFGGAIGGTGGIVKQGTGTQTLTGANTYTGGTAIAGGTLALGAGGSLSATGAVNLTGAGATFDITGSGDLAAQTIGALSGVAGSKVIIGRPLQLLQFGDATNQTFAGTISGSGGIVKAGSGTTTLTGANTYTGTTTIHSGTLALGAGGSFATSGYTSVDSGAVLDLSGGTGSQLLGILSGNPGAVVKLGSNALTLNGTGSAVYGGTISGSGSLTVAINGTQNLTGANTYTGGTSLISGNLSIGNDAALGSGPLNVIGNGKISMFPGVTLSNLINVGAGATMNLFSNDFNNFTLAGRVTGAGGVVLSGVGKITLTSASDYTGGTTVYNGTFALGAGGSLASTGALTLAGPDVTFDVSGATGAQTIGALSGVAGTNVTLGANTLAVNGNGTTFAGTIGGTGGVTVASGSQVLTGSNTYTGGTTLATAGTLQIGNGGTSGSIAGNVADSGALVFNRSDNLSFGGAISGTGSLTQAGSGQLTLTGTSTLSGPTTVSAGTLAVNGSLGPSIVTVQNGATLTGTGTIGGLVVQSGATAAASQPGAALNVAGNVTFQPGSTFQVAATPQQSGSLAAGGAATLNGGTVQVLANQSGYQPSTTYTILSAASGVQGAFSQVSANYAFLMPKLSYDPNHVYLQLVANGTALPDVATTPNQRSVATAIGGLGAGNAVYDTVLTTDASTARRAYGLLDGELQASMKSMLLLDSRYVRDAVTDRVRQGLAPGSGPLAALSSGGAALCGDNTAGAVDPTLPPERRIGSREGCYGGTPYQPVVWGQAFGGRSRLAGDGNASSVNRSMTGFIAGADMALNDKWRAGLAAGVTHSSLDNDQSSSASVNSYYLSLYGGAQYGALGVRGGASYTWYRINSDRYPGFAGFSDHDSAGYDANSAQVFGEVGYALPVGPVAIEPFAGLAYVNLHTDGYTETGGAAALRAGGETTHVGFSTLGLRAASQLGSIASGTLTARGTVGWRHAFGNVRPSSAFTFANGGTSFQVSGVPIARDSAVLEAGIDANITKRLTLGLTYSGQFGSGVRDNAVLGNILWKF